MSRETGLLKNKGFTSTSGPSTPGLFSSYRNAFVGFAWLAISLAIVTLFLPWEASNRVEQALKANVRREAEIWSGRLVSASTGLSSVALSGALPPSAEISVGATPLGPAERLTLFTPDGHILAILDAEQVATAFASPVVNGRAARVFRTKQAEVSVHRNENPSGDLETHAQAYVPVYSSDGIAFGVIKLHSDASQLATLLENSHLAMLGRLVAFVFLVTVAPVLFLLLQSMRMRRSELKLDEVTRFDPLTKVMNRRTFDRFSRQCFETRASDQKIAVLHLDMDRFRKVNESFGALVGDEVLASVSRAIARVAEEHDAVAARVAGDEFVVLLPMVGDATPASFCEVLRHAVSEPVSTRSGTYIPSVSIGAHLSEGIEGNDAALRKAALALQHAKAMQPGRTVQYFDGLSEASERRRMVEDRIRTALENDLFTLVFQPLQDRSGNLVGFETLLRLSDAKGRAIGPSEFIPIAESSGLIGEVGRWSLHSAAQTLANWPDDVWLAVNLSGLQFLDDTLVEEITAAQQAAGISPERLHLEVTESMLLDDVPGFLQQIETLSDLGFHLAMDDFGTGYSSLGNLWRYPFHTVKLDRSFIETAKTDPETAEKVVSATVAMAHGMDLVVTVEGVETQAQLDLIWRAGADLVQGYVIGRPMTADEVEAHIGRRVA